MLTPYLPYPPSEGGQVRSYKLIKLLSKSHEITLVCFSRLHNTQEQIDHMKQFCRKVIVIERGKTWTLSNILRTGFSLYPFLVSIYYSKKIREVLTFELANDNYDLIHAEMSYTLPYLPKDHKLPVILVEQTIMSRIFTHQAKTDRRLWFRPFMFLDIAKMKYWERYFWKKVNRVVTVSEEDADVVKKIIPGLRVDVVPNGVGEDVSNLPRKIHFNHNILYMGNYKWIQNWEAAELLAKEVFPLIRKKIPTARLIIAGQSPTKDVMTLANNHGISILKLEDDDFKGVVDCYLNAGLFVAPMYAPGGTRLKILAAMASMVPVVTTTIGAEGYGAKNKESILLGNSSQEIADRAVEVLNNRKLYQRIALGARRLVDEHFTWEPIAEKLEKIYKEIVNEKP